MRNYLPALAVGPFGMGPLELVIILAIVVVLFGATRIGDIGKGIGRGIREFRREVREGREDPTSDDASSKEPAETGEKKS